MLVGESGMVNRLLVTGGIRSGKTGMAEQRALAAGTEVVYLATATAGDDEMAWRIERHQSQRPAAWGLVEEPVRLGQGLRDFHERPGSAPLLLIDCVCLWMRHLRFAGDAAFRQQRGESLAELACYRVG